MSAPWRWLRRAALSLLAGGAGLGGPLTPGALGSETSTTATPSGEGSTTPVTETTPQAPAPGGTTGQQGTASEPTTTSTTTTTPASTTTTPAPSAPSPTPAPTSTSPAQPASTQAPTVVVQREQQSTPVPPRPAKKHSSSTAAGKSQGEEAATQGHHETNGGAATGPSNDVAPAPQTVGGEAGTLASLAEAAASKQALDFYRIPLFLLPIYQAAAIQYDVPWQILAAINEVETDYGSDQSVSSAGAVGWMQFMPQTWLLYGVDATDAGYADPYNPVDAIFAAARYLRAAGAAKHLRASIFAYNHSQAYVEAVLLRARLIASYPSAAIDTLTGLVDGRLPTFDAKPAAGAVYLPGTTALGTSGTTGSAGAEVAGSSNAAGAAADTASANSPSSATAGALPASPLVAGARATQGNADTAGDDKDAAKAVSTRSDALPGSIPPAPPQVEAARAAARARAAANAPAKPSQLLELDGKPGAAVVAVQGGRVVHLGDTKALGQYLVLRDVYGDVFTYAGLGSIAPRYQRSKPPTRPAQLVKPAQTPTPNEPASAGHQEPQTLQAKAHAAEAHGATAAAAETETEPTAGLGKVRLYAHPDNPLARAAAKRGAKSAASGRWRPLKVGALVSQGTVLGHISTAPAASAGQLRFAVRPAGDDSTIDPVPLLDNWRELSAALHPAGSKGTEELLGATADAVFQMSKSELQSSVLSDPDIQLDACARRDIGAGAVDRRVLATLEFLSRNGLAPTVDGLRCARERETTTGVVFEHFDGNAFDISAINGTPIAGHQGPGTLTDATIRTLLTLPRQLAPAQIVSLMHYPQAPSTFARPSAWDRIRIDFGALVAQARTARTGGHSSVAAKSAPATGAGGSLSTDEWNQLIERVAALPQPSIVAKPSSAAVRDPQTAAKSG